MDGPSRAHAEGCLRRWAGGLPQALHAPPQGAVGAGVAQQGFSQGFPLHRCPWEDALVRSGQGTRAGRSRPKRGRFWKSVAQQCLSPGQELKAVVGGREGQLAFHQGLGELF